MSGLAAEAEILGAVKNFVNNAVPAFKSNPKVTANDDPYQKWYKLRKAIFEKDLVYDLFAGAADNQSTDKLRAHIREELSRLGEDKLADEALEASWQKYISINFPGPDALKWELGKYGYSESFVKSKFKDNLLMSRYFEKVVRPQIFSDLKKQESLVIKADQDEIDISVNEIKLKFIELGNAHGGEVSFEALLQQAGFSKEEFEHEIKKELLAAKAEERLNQLTEAELQEEAKVYYHNRIANFQIPAKMFFRQVFLDRSLKEDHEQFKMLKDTLKEVHAKLIEGEDFKDLALDYADEYISFEQMIEPAVENSEIYIKDIWQSLMAMEAGQVSEIIKSKIGLHVLILDQVVEARTISFEEFASLSPSETLVKREEPIPSETVSQLVQEPALEIPEPVQPTEPVKPEPVAKVHEPVWREPEYEPPIMEVQAPMFDLAEEQVTEAIEEFEAPEPVIPVLVDPPLKPRVVVEEVLELVDPPLKPRSVEEKIQEPIKREQEYEPPVMEARAPEPAPLSPEQKLEEKIQELRARIPDSLADLRQIKSKVLINANRSRIKSKKSKIDKLSSEVERLERVIRRMQSFQNY